MAGKVLNYGSLNIDLVYTVPHIVRPGETLTSLNYARFPGGKGLNQSIALKRAGAETCHAGSIGEDGRFLAATVAFIINYACYFSEIFRGGIQSIPVGQYEAGQVLGLTKTQTFFRVVLLQVVKRIVPPMSNEIITLVKDTSLARIIALQEIIWAGQAFMKGSHGISGAIWPMFFTMVYYLFASGILAVLLGRLEKKLDYFKV